MTPKLSCVCYSTEQLLLILEHSVRDRLLVFNLKDEDLTLAGFSLVLVGGLRLLGNKRPEVLRHDVDHPLVVGESGKQNNL